MADYTLEPSSDAIFGMTGSGKTTLALELLQHPAACRFIFDDRGLMSNRLGIRKCYSANDLESALADQWVAFYPHKMFPPEIGTKKERADVMAFKFFYKWVYGCAKRAPGKKMILSDEVWQYCARNYIPFELDAVFRMGREENLEGIIASQTPRLTPENLIGQLTDVYIFKLDAALELEFIRKNFPVDIREVARLPMGSYIHWDKLRNRFNRGKVF